MTKIDKYAILVLTCFGEPITSLTVDIKENKLNVKYEREYGRS